MVTMMSRLAWTLSLCAAVLCAHGEASAAGPVDVARDVLPILEDRCHACHGPALVTLDKLDKIGPDGVAGELAARGIGSEASAALLFYFNVQVGADSAVHRCDDELDRLGGYIHDEVGRAALENLRAIVGLVGGTRAASRMRVDPSLARGLSYYTGAIMEVAVTDLAGSLGGGGRYDHLIGMFSGRDIPACGFSLGLERVLVVMAERGMFPPSLASSPADVMVAIFDTSTAPHALRVADQMRACGLRVLVYPDAEKLGKQIKYADGRGVPFVALLGDDEIRAGTVTVKDLAAKTQHTYEQAAAGAAILGALRQRG